jgi:hypothetical protein
VRIVRFLLCLAAVLVAACARHRTGVPENESEELLRQTTPEEWERMMAREYPPCKLGADVAMDSWRPWPLAFVKSTLRLPAGFRSDERPRDGARASWSRADSSVIEVMGTEALTGLAVAGAHEEEPPCTIRVLEHRAPVHRLLFVRAERPETTHFAVVATVLRRGEGLAVAVWTRTSAGRDSLLWAIAALERAR